MKYKSQKVAYWFFGLCMLLFALQIIYGFIMGFAELEWMVFTILFRSIQQELFTQFISSFSLLTVSWEPLIISFLKKHNEN